MPGKRQIGAPAILLGGILAAIASFLPWVRTYYPAVLDEPASTVFNSPWQSLARPLQISLLVAPIVLAAIGLSVLRHGDMAPRPRVWIASLMLALLGAAWTIPIAMLLYSFAGGFSVSHTNTLEYGPAIALLGYLLAFVGALLLRAASAAPQTHVRT
jgi:hypothetical protein